MKIQRMTPQHLDGALKIENECFSHPWTRENLENELNNPTSVFFTALENDEVIGYIGMSTVNDEGYIFNVAVTGSQRKKGIGSALIGEIVTYCKKNNFAFVTLEVRQSNQKAISLYSHFGFIKVGERKSYYRDPEENAILMTKYF